MTTEERLAVENATVSDARIRAIVGEGKPRIITTGVEVDKAEAEEFLAGKSATLPRRQVSVVLFNPQTNQAALALVSPSENRVISVEPITVSDIPYMRDDADLARARWTVTRFSNQGAKRAFRSRHRRFLYAAPIRATYAARTVASISFFGPRTGISRCALLST